MLTYGSVCSGIEAASVAWEPLGFKPKWFSEIEPFPSAVLNHHWPSVINLGDMTKIASRIQSGEVEAPEVMVGGTPCQAFSVAGARKGLADDRGQLTISYGELADAIDDIRIAGGKHPAVIVWENVPGVLSSKDNAFGAFLGLLSGEECELVPPGRKWSNAGCVFGPKRTVAWRILDAQYFGVAQRRRRVFVVASARKDFDPTSVLFEREGVRRDTAPSREAGSVVTGKAGASVKVGSHWDGCGYAHPTLSQSHNTGGIGASNQEIFSQRGAGLVEGFRMVAFGEYADDDTASTMKARDYKDATDLAVAYSVSLRGREGGATAELGDDVAGCLRASSGGGDKPYVLAGVVGNTKEPTPLNLQVITRHNQLGRATGFGLGEPWEASYTLGAGHMHGVWHEMTVRRLTPTECERLQGFPDGHTQVPYRGKPAADGPRYKSLGNSMAVCCMSWIGQRILSQLNLATPGIQAYALEQSISDDEHCALKGEYPVEFQFDLFREYA